MWTLAVQNSYELICIWSLYACTECYTIAACFPFEPLEKCTTFKDIFPGLSRTLSFNFQDFPGPGIFKKKIQEFPEGVGTLCMEYLSNSIMIKQ